MEYVIEVTMEPHYHDNKNKPYFWCLLKIHEDGIRTNDGSRWSETPELAFKEANEFYKLKEANHVFK